MPHGAKLQFESISLRACLQFNLLNINTLSLFCPFMVRFCLQIVIYLSINDLSFFLYDFLTFFALK